MSAAPAPLLDELRFYVASDEHEEAMRARIVAFLESEPRAFARACAFGHITASTWIVDRARTRTLLTHHRKLGKWLQLGGHVDGERDVRAAAMREAREESGLATLRFVSEAIYDVDVHRIPVRGAETEHDHFDIRFALEADPGDALVVSEESHDLAWVALDALRDYDVDESVMRLARKTRSRIRTAVSDSQSTDTAAAPPGTARS